jgi:hypothetical protein
MGSRASLSISDSGDGPGSPLTPVAAGDAVCAGALQDGGHAARPET